MVNRRATTTTRTSWRILHNSQEMGNVENTVGYLRPNFMVAEPEAATLDGLNEVLLSRCDALENSKPH